MRYQYTVLQSNVRRFTAHGMHTLDSAEAFQSLPVGSALTSFILSLINFSHAEFCIQSCLYLFKSQLDLVCCAFSFLLVWHAFLYLFVVLAFPLFCNCLFSRILIKLCTVCLERHHSSTFQWPGNLSLSSSYPEKYSLGLGILVFTTENLVLWKQNKLLIMFQVGHSLSFSECVRQH